MKRNEKTEVDKMVQKEASQTTRLSRKRGKNKRAKRSKLLNNKHMIIQSELISRRKTG